MNGASAGTGDSRTRRRLAALAMESIMRKGPGKSAGSQEAQASQPLEPRVDRVPGLDSLGTIARTPSGTTCVVTTLCDVDHAHGRVGIAGSLSVRADHVAMLALDPSLANADISKIVFIDTETTGLAGGAGTVPFVVGLAWFEDGALRVDQLVLPDFPDEAAMLAVVAERISWASLIASYNGKSFDWPLLRQRFILNRVPVPTIPLHLDLLHCARRVYRRRLRGVRLVDVEREVLGFHRVDDIPGELIPRTYFDYLSSGDVHGIRAVVDHNRWDVIALAAVLPALVREWEEVRPEADPRDHLSLAEVALRVSDIDRARAFARQAAECSGAEDISRAANLILAKIARRLHLPDDEQAALLSALDVSKGSDDDAAPVHLWLAKHYEHRRKDVARAIPHAERGATAEDFEVATRRKARLQKRLQTSVSLPSVDGASRKR